MGLLDWGNVAEASVRWGEGWGRVEGKLRGCSFPQQPGGVGLGGKIEGSGIVRVWRED